MHGAHAQVWLLWPFLVWGALVTLAYALAYTQLADTRGPVALFNIVNFVMVQYNRNIFFLQELVWVSDLAEKDALR